MSELAGQIEVFLSDRRDWVSADEICQRFCLKDERQLRQVGNKPGLCSGFAISGDKGFKHVSIASTGEWLRFKHRLRRHGIQELIRVKLLGSKRRDVLRRPGAAHRIEKDSGQFLLPGVGVV